MSEDFNEKIRKLAAQAMPDTAASRAFSDLTRASLTESTRLSALTGATATETMAARIAKDLTLVSGQDLAGNLARINDLSTVPRLHEELERQRIWARMAQPAWNDLTTATAFANLRTHTFLEDFERCEKALRDIMGPATNYAKLAEITATGITAGDYLSVAARAAMGPLADLKASGALDSLTSSIAAAKGAELALAGYESRFKLPAADELVRLSSRFTEAESVVARFGADILNISRRVNSPWLDTENPARSVVAFAELHGLARSVTAFEPYSDQLLKALRSSLGDWRDVIAAPSTVVGDLSARSAFYIKRGFHAELTDFPAAAFEACLEVAELTVELPTLVDQYGEPIEPSDDEDASAFARTNLAHLWLMRFETQFRQFIDVRMTQAYGSDWPRRQLPNGLYDKWLGKKRKADEAGRPSLPLICYADFTDYELIICRRDNWKSFEVHFKDQANVRESLHRLHLPRVETMHARPLSQDDELYLYSEVKRLAKAFKSN
jgi:hypothetical protein